MRVDAKVNDLVYGQGRIIAVSGEVIEVFFKDMGEVKYFEYKNGELFLFLDEGLAKNATASFSSRVNLGAKKLTMSRSGKNTRGILLKRVTRDSRSFQIAHSIINENLSKVEIFDALKIDVRGKSIGGYHSNTFSALSDSGVIQFDRKEKKWGKGPEYDYFLYVVTQ